MRSIIAITQLSLDGVMQGPGGPEEDPTNGFPHGGWAMPFGDEVLMKVLHETVACGHDLLLGRRTYDIFAGYWPKHGDDPVGVAFNAATKHVVTRGGAPLEWRTSKRLGGVDDVRSLKESVGPELHVWGSSRLLQALIAADLVDEYRMWIAPVVLGAGKRLFEAGVPPRRLSLVSTTSTPSGVLLDTYRPAGPLTRA
jgi:dihydrofolate reductase